MKKHFLLIALATMASLTAFAQKTFTVTDGAVAWRYDVASLDTKTMTFGTDGLTIDGHCYSLSDATTMTVAAGTLEPLTVDVVYAAGTARVTAPGALADRLTISVSGASVDITDALVSTDGTSPEVTYRLSGVGESFVLHGDYKSTVVLDGVTLTALGTLPALWIDNGKRIDFKVTDGTTNTFRDAATNEKKGAFHVKGHAEWKGGGSVSIAGTSRHAYSSNEYSWFRSSFTGNFAVTHAGSDGLHIEQYLQIDGGTFNIAGNLGDGIDVSCTVEADGTTPTQDEKNGQFLMNGGTVTVTATAAATKGLKSEGTMTITAGRINATAEGDGSRGIQTADNLYLGLEGATDAKGAYLYLTANGGEYTDPATADSSQPDVDKCRGLKVKKNFYHYPSTVERNTASVVGKKKVVDVDGTYFNQGGTLVEITIQ